MGLDSFHIEVRFMSGWKRYGIGRAWLGMLAAGD